MSQRGLMVRVHGRVQGVGFRYACRHEAERLGILGWVRNRRDGSVETCIVGEDAAVAAMRSWLQQGPNFADVREVVAKEVQVSEPLNGFRIRPDD